jgi:hypothetical protein
MKPNRGYDEVMIVNPYDPQSTNQQINLMRFHQSPQIGYYAAEPEPGYYAAPAEMSYYGQPAGYGNPYGYYPDPSDLGWYPEPPEVSYYGNPGYGYYAQPDFTSGYYGEPAMGYYGEPAMGYYGEPAMGYYGEPPMGYYGDRFEPVGYYADEQPMGWYPDSPDMSGYADYQPLSDYPESVVGYNAEREMSGYVRQTATPSYNPGCPIPTNVAGYGEREQLLEGDPFSGYQRPATVNASCGQFTPQPGVSDFVPETFRPLW